MKKLRLVNRQRAHTVDSAYFRRAALVLLRELLRVSTYQLAIHFISARRMAEINKQFLGHEGSTDVITFDYNDSGYRNASETESALSGEIFISPADAARQSLTFRRPPQEEILRYIVHGVLHLQGYDDLKPTARKKMKSAETLLLKKLLKITKPM